MIFTLGVRFHKLKIREMDPIPKAIVKFQSSIKKDSLCAMMQRCRSNN